MKRHVKTAMRDWKYYKRANLTINVTKRWIVLNGDVTKETAEVFYRALFSMQVASVELPITVKIVRSRGGKTFAAMAIYGMLRTCFTPVKAIIKHYAHSSACYIFQGASERIMMPGSIISLHWAVLPGCDDGRTIEDVAADYRCLNIVNDGLYSMIRKRADMPLEAVKKLCKTSAPLGPEDALKLGLADKIGKRRKCRGKSKK